MESWGCVWFVDTEGRMPRQEELINFEVHSHDFFFFISGNYLDFQTNLVLVFPYALTPEPTRGAHFTASVPFSLVF